MAPACVAPRISQLHGRCAQGRAILFKPDWTRHAKAAPSKRNDELLSAMPIGLIVFPGSGVSDNLADMAKRLGVPLFDHRPCAR
jgi:hypothetical protein